MNECVEPENSFNILALAVDSILEAINNLEIFWKFFLIVYLTGWKIINSKPCEHSKLCEICNVA